MISSSAGNDVITVVIAIILGYLLGSIPSAYIASRLIKGKDIRQLGGGNVGALNTFRQVGRWAGFAVLLADVGKGAAAVAIAQSLKVPLPFILLTGMAVVAGHIWSIFLRFSGGRGMATFLGVLAILMPRELLIVLVIAAIPIVITRNIPLFMSVGLASVPVSAWVLEKSGLLVAFSTILLLGMGLNFLPTARIAWAKSKGVKDFVWGR